MDEQGAVRSGATPRVPGAGQPDRCERLDEFEPREVRRILVGRYEIRYELLESTVQVLRLWHTREDR
jgi:plasmid stabilization system protein ParE